MSRLGSSKGEAEAGRRQGPTPTPRMHRWLDAATGILVYLQAILAPWLFGTTDPQMMKIMSVGGYCIGFLLLAKWVYRLFTGYRPVRWNEFLNPSPSRWEKIATGVLAILTVLFLGYCVVGAWNARATFYRLDVRFEYHDAIPWLPHSYDSNLTWFAIFWTGALACFFWGLRDWLLTVTGADRANREGMPRRLKVLLWVVCINGALLATEGILQKLSGSNKLLWLVVPRINSAASGQFGPYAYRSNAAQYFNLLWPVCLAFWYWLGMEATARDRHARFGSNPRMFLLPCAILMGACPIISASRGGAFVAAVEMLGAGAVLLIGHRSSHWVSRAAVLAIFILILGAGAALGWRDLGGRFKQGWENDTRALIYSNAERMAEDFPLFGTGLGTFEAMYQLYLKSPAETWEDVAHNDWLETRVTTGLVGLTMLMLVLLFLFLHWFGRGGFAMPWEVAALIWIGLGGCLLHAKVDFPLQVYSVLGMFVLLSCLVFSGSRPTREEMDN